MRFAQWLIQETDLSYLLSPPSETPQIGQEKGEPVENGIATFVSPHGSYRYVYYSQGNPIGALQVVTRNGKRATVANVFTHPKYRRQKIASHLLAKAEGDFKSVQHQPYDSLSDDGKSWVDSLD